MTKTQLNVRVASDVLTIVAALQTHYAKRMGLSDGLTQAQAVEIALRETAQREGLKTKGAK